ncbi:hypothetical protein NX08_000685 [Xanthomonas vasicola]|nr:hypothetical protein NX08_000685 [Xanthomonas vasicola]
MSRRPTTWCGVLAACGTVGGMDAAIEPHGRVYGVSRERRGRSALDSARFAPIMSTSERRNGLPAARLAPIEQTAKRRKGHLLFRKSRNRPR